MGNGNGALCDRSQPGVVADCPWPNASVRADQAESVAQAPDRFQSGHFQDSSVALDGVKAPAETTHSLIKSLGHASSAGGHRLSLDLDYRAPWDRNWRQKPQETHPVLARIAGAAECFQQRSRQLSSLENRHESSTSDFPIRRARNVIAPEGLPASNGCSIDAKQR